MGVILPTEIDAATAKRINAFTKNFEIRVHLFNNSVATTPVSTTSVADGDYVVGTGIYDVPARVWAKRFWIFSSSRSTETSLRVDYKDMNDNWITCYVAHDTGTAGLGIVDLEVSMYANSFRFEYFNPVDPTDTYIPTDIRIYSESRLDITKHTRNEINIEDSVDILTENVMLPHTSIGLINDDGRWLKSGYVEKLIYDGRTAEGEETSSVNISSATTRGCRIVVFIKYYGPDWEDGDWIILSNFYTRKWSMNTVSGETAWVAKTKLHPPVLENLSAADIIDKTIAMKEGQAQFQVNRQDDEEIITIENEYIGDVEYYLVASPPSIPDKLLEGTKVWCHCSDGTYIYYMVKKQGTYLYHKNCTYFALYRMTHSGNNIEHITNIYSVAAKFYVYGGYTMEYSRLHSTPRAWGVEPDSSSIIQNMTMCVDDEYIYLGFTSNCFALWYHEALGEQPEMCSESKICRILKIGPVMGEVFDRKRSGSYLDSPAAYHDLFSGTGQARRGLNGFYDDTETGQEYSPDRRVTAMVRCKIGGAEKLLTIESVLVYGSTGKVQEVWKHDPDLSNRIKINDLPNGILITAAFVYDDSRFCVQWRDNSASKEYIGMAHFNSATGAFEILSYGSLESNTNARALSFLGDSIYVSGTGWSKTNRVVTNAGITQAYKCVFIADGSHMIHELHETRNNYLSHRFPLLSIGGADVSKDHLEYGVEYVEGDIFYNIGWTINLKTGEIKFRQIIAPGDLNEIRLSYDYVNKYLFFIVESKNRLGDDCLGKISQSQFGNYLFDEVGTLNKLPFLQQQTVSLKSSILDYYTTDSDAGEYTGIFMTNAIGDDRLSSFEFTPEYDGVLHTVKFPVKLQCVGTVLGNPWVAVDVDIYITDEGVDYRSADKLKPDTPPVNANIKLLASSTMHIDTAKVPKSGSGGTVWVNGDASPYVWRSFDVSAADEKVLAGGKYGIIIRIHNTGDLFNYYGMAKITAMATHNRTIDFHISDGADITAMSDSAWNVEDYGSNGVCMYSVVEIRKDKFPLKSLIIIDALHPDIDSGFMSNLGGSDSTIAVKSQDLLTIYDRGLPGYHYSVSFSGGQFWIENEWGGMGIDDVVVVQWFDGFWDAALELPVVKSTPRELLEESAEHGDNSTFLGVEIIGEKLLPAPRSVTVEQILPVPLGTYQPIDASTKQRVEGDSAYDIRSWNETKKQFRDPDSSTADSQKFALDFKDPFMCGTTGYMVKYGKGLATDLLEDGSLTPGPERDVPLFWRINMLAPGNGFDNDEYHIIFQDDNYRTWRLCTENDTDDMIDNTIVGDTGNADTHFVGSWDDEPLKGSSHFYVKHMNKYYGGGDTLNWIAYESEDRLYYIDKYGAVVHDDSYVVDSDKNPSDTSYFNKVIVVELGVENSQQVPLFEAHGESGKPGYDAAYSDKIKEWARVKIDRVDIKPRGISAIYTNTSGYNKFVRFLVIGYPLNTRLGIEFSKLLDGSDHADAQIAKIDNHLIQSHEVARLKGQQIIDFWGQDRPPIDREMPFTPMLRPGMVVRMSSELLGLEDRLFFIHRRSASLSVGGMKTSLKQMIQI